MSYRLKLSSNKKSKKEHELRIFANPFVHAQLRFMSNDDYQAPLSSSCLRSNSKWFIVRHNLHKIRSWGGIQSNDSNPVVRDWYLFFQMRRELRRLQEYLKTIQTRRNFLPVQYFYLPIDEQHRQRFDVSHVKSNDAIYYASFSSEPIVLQSLLYYFSRECAVPYNSIFRSFLSDICSIIYRDQQYLTRVTVFRRLALIMTVIVIFILAFMFITLILGVLKTTSDFHQMYENDPNGGLEWQPI